MNSVRATTRKQIDRPVRGGYTLLETTVAVVAASFLIVGLASAMMLSANALNDAASADAQDADAAAVVDRVTADVAHATAFTDRTATAATFTVPDRDGDKQPETLRYSWSGVSGAPLMLKVNGGAASAVASGVPQFGFSWQTRTITGSGFAKGDLGLSYDGFTEAKAGLLGLFTVDWIAIDTPAGTGPGDLLIAAVAVSDDLGTFTVPSGWNILAVRTDSHVSLGIAWKIAGLSESTSHTFHWTRYEFGYGWMMRFTGPHPTNPIHVYNVASPSWSMNPTAPSVTTTTANTLVLRLAAIELGDITVDAPGLAGHDSITMDRNSSRISGGAGYRLQLLAGPTGTADFALTKNRYHIAATIAIAPEP